MSSIYDQSFSDLEEFLVSRGLKPFRARQIFKWLYDKRVDCFEEMTDISKSLQQDLSDAFSFTTLKMKDVQISRDGTRKYLFELEDGCLIESVFMIFDYGYSACVSSQVGCNMGCTFCASGLLKKQRDLTVSEIVLQVLMIQKELDKEDKRLGNIVVMGTGEPFDNYDNVMKALSIINDPLGLKIGSRHISISTCGLVPKIRRFAKEGVQYNLAISLHAANDELRSRIMPVNRAYPLAELFDALKEYTASNNRRLTFEYLLLAGINDREEDAKAIRELFRGLNAYINLIPYNEVKENDYHATSDKNALRFYDILKKNGVSVTLRQKKGDDIDAACGQLRANHMR